MRQLRLTVWGYWLGVAVSLVLAAPTQLTLAENSPQSSTSIGNEAQQGPWEQGLVLLATGQFDKASEIIHKVAAQGVPDKRISRVDTWLSGFEKLQTARKKRILDDHKKYVAWTKEEAEAARKAGAKGKRLWQQAIAHCEYSLRYVKDKSVLLNEPWLLDVAGGAYKAAQSYENEGKFLEAAGIYVLLKEIFEYHKEYDEALERCRAHIRLELTYTPDSEWAVAVKGIMPAMATTAFDLVEKEYLKEPDFKEALIGGLEQILMIAKKEAFPTLKSKLAEGFSARKDERTVSELAELLPSRKDEGAVRELAKVFPALKDEEAVKEFCIRVNVYLRRAEKSEEVSVEDLKSTFEKLLKINNEVKLLPQDVLIYEFVHGALKPLDRFSDPLWPADLAEFQKHTQGKFSGVGISILKRPGEPIKVVSPLGDTPAYREGIQPGDLITGINGKACHNFSIHKAVREITGPQGTAVTLTIKRIGVDEEFEVTLEREEITIFTIKGYERDKDGQWDFMIDPAEKIGYIRMTSFTESTIDELKNAVIKLRQEQDMRGLIFDLRDNPGGLLKPAVEVSDMFLEGDKRIVSTKDRQNKHWAMSSTNETRLVDFPMILLVNGASASASEIVTGALQVHNRALVVGDRTYGKGSVQHVLPLTNTHQALLKLTTALYYLPNGRCIHRNDDSTTWGVDPDVEVKLVPKELVKFRELLRKRDILKGKDQEKLTDEELQAAAEYKPHTQPADDEEDTEANDESAQAEKDEEDLPPIKRYDPNVWPSIDPQMEAALMLMRIRLETELPWPRQPAEVVAAPTESTSG